MSALEIELVFDELGTHQRLLRHPLRSKKPRGVIQEFYGLVLAHYAVRTLMAQAAQTRHLDPDRISFARAARLLPAGLLLGDLLAPAAREELITALWTLLIQVPLPPRRSRHVPRARKRSALKALFRQRTRAYRITAVPPFRCRVTIHAPPAPA